MGIESTAHTFGASVVDESGRILSDIRDVYRSAAGSGIHPREAAEHHSEVAARVLGGSLKQAAISATELGGVAIALGPGLGPCLRVGATVARSLSTYLRIPLIPVNHAIGHIEIGILTTGATDPLVVLVSGGHTAIAAFSGGRWRIFGETEDITIGNLFDMFAREINLPSPAGQQIEKLTQENAGKFIPLPYVVKGNDVSYSGLLTASLAKLRSGEKLEDVCYSMQEVSCSMLAEAVERSLAYTGKKEILLTGGVAANKSLQDKLEKVAAIHNAVCYTVRSPYTGDNGAQIAWTGVLSLKAGVVMEVENSRVRPRWRLEDVDTPWRS